MAIVVPTFLVLTCVQFICTGECAISASCTTSSADEDLDVVMLQVNASVQMRSMNSSRSAGKEGANFSTNASVHHGSYSFREYIFTQMIHVHLWTVVLLVAVVALSTVYSVAYVLWCRKARRQRLANLKAAKEHSKEGSMLGRLVEMCIEHLDKQLFGVNVDFESVEIKPYEGVLEIRGVVIENPQSYWSEHFARAELVLVDIDMEALLLSGGSRLIIQEIHVRDVDVIWERAMFSSNLSDIMKNLRMDTDGESTTPQDTAGNMRLEVQKVEMEEISLKLASYRLAGAGIRAMVSDIYFENYSEEAGGKLISASKLLPLILQSFVLTLMANIIGRAATQAILEGFNFLARDFFGCFVHAVSGLFAKMCCCLARGKKSPKPDKPKKVSKPPKSVDDSVSCSSCMAPCQKLLQSAKSREVRRAG